MKRIAVINIVGLSTSIIGEHTPFIQRFIDQHRLYNVKPVLPAVTTSVQTTYLTGLHPKDHGIVGNGWYDKADAEIKFWKQSHKLVQGESIWQTAKKKNPAFTCAQMFWWYNMYNDVDFSATPRPNYLADGRKIPDCYTSPSNLRDELTSIFGKFPLFNFWGPTANIKSSEWIANAAMYVEQKHQPTLNLVYLPHLDYSLQKFGPNAKETKVELQAIDALVEKLVTFFLERKIEVLLLSEYGIAPVNNPIHINRILRKEGLLEIRTERGRELLDTAACKAFAVADHQIAHVHVKDDVVRLRLKSLLAEVPGIAKVLDKTEMAAYHVNHERAGDLILLAEQDAWFTYYFWEDDALAPDYARMVDIHKKPGYDPVELFMSSKTRTIYKLLLKKIGLRAILDIIPLEANLVKGSHGIIDIDPAYQPVLIGNLELDNEVIDPTHIKQLLLDKIFVEHQVEKLTYA